MSDDHVSALTQIPTHNADDVGIGLSRIKADRLSPMSSHRRRIDDISRLHTLLCKGCWIYDFIHKRG